MHVIKSYSMYCSVHLMLMAHVTIQLLHNYINMYNSFLKSNLKNKQTYHIYHAYSDKLLIMQIINKYLCYIHVQGCTCMYMELTETQTQLLCNNWYQLCKQQKQKTCLCGCIISTELYMRQIRVTDYKLLAPEFSLPQLLNRVYQTFLYIHWDANTSIQVAITILTPAIYLDHELCIHVNEGMELFPSTPQLVHKQTQIHKRFQWIFSSLGTSIKATCKVQTFQRFISIY